MAEPAGYDVSNPRQKKTLERIARTVPLRSRQHLLDAVLPREVEEHDLIAFARRLRRRRAAGKAYPSVVLDEACRVLPRAFEVLRRASVAQKQALNGVSMPLLALTAGEGLTVLDLAGHWEQEMRRAEVESRRRAEAAASRRDEVAQAERRLRQDRRAATQLCGEVRKLLERVADGDARLGLGRTPRRRPSVAQVVAELDRLADRAEALLAHEVRAVRARAFLFGLDPAGVQSWRDVGAALRATEKATLEEDPAAGPSSAATGARALEATEVEIDGAVARIVVLLTLVSDGFRAGHRVDPSLPRLTLSVSARSLLNPRAGRRRGRRRRRRGLASGTVSSQSS